MLNRNKLTISNYAWLMASPAIIGLIMFVIIPLILAMSFSFTNQTMLKQSSKFVGLKQYEKLLSVKIIKQIDLKNNSVNRKQLRTELRKNHKGYRKLGSVNYGDNIYYVVAKDPEFLKSIYNIVRFVIMVVPLQMGLALLMALMINNKVRGQSSFRTLFFAPVVTSMAVVSVVWTFLYDKDHGLLNQWLNTASFGIIPYHDWLGNTNTAMVSIVVMSAWQGAGFQMIIFLSGLQNIPTDLYEAAELDGAGVIKKFLHITIPGLKNTLTFILISITAAAFALYVQIDIMTQGGPDGSTNTVMYHAINYGYKSGNIAYASAISVIYFIIILLISLVQLYWRERKQ